MLPIAVADREGTVGLVLDDERQRRHAYRQAGPRRAEALGEHIGAVQTLLAMLTGAGLTEVSALKIDVEGAEDLVLVPVLA